MIGFGPNGQARIYIDMNERVAEDIFLLSKEDSKVDSKGNQITFYENMPIHIWSDDGDGKGNQDNLLADAIAIKYDLSDYPCWRHIKWCCKINMATIIHESEYNYCE